MEIKNLFTPEAQKWLSTAYQGIKKKIKPFTDVWTDLYNQNVEAIQPALSQVKDTINTGFIKPIMKPIQETKQKTQAIGDINTFFNDAGITIDDIKALAEEEWVDFNEVLTKFQNNGIKVQGIDELQKQQEAKANEIPQWEDLGIMGNIKEGAIGAFRAGEQIPSIAGNVLDFTTQNITWPLIAGGADLLWANEFADKWRAWAKKFWEWAKKLWDDITMAGMTDGWTNPLTQNQIDARKFGGQMSLTAPIGGSYIAWAKWLGWLALRSWVVGAWFGWIQPIIDKGGETTASDIWAWTVVWWVTGAVAWPLISKVVAPTIGWIVSKTGKYGKALIEWGTKWIKKSIGEDITALKDVVWKIETPISITRWGVNVIDKYYPWFKDAIADIDAQTRLAVENATPEKIAQVIKDAKDAKLNPQADYMQTPYHKWVEEQAKNLKTIDENLANSQNSRIQILQEVPQKPVNLEATRQTLTNEFKKMNLDTTVDANGNLQFVPVQWRSPLIDMSNPADIKAIGKLQEILNKDTTPLQTMDNIHILQDWIYENKSSMWVKWISQKMEWVVSKIQRSLNENFKNQLPPEYRKIMDSMSEDIQMKENIQKLFGIDDNGNLAWNRGELTLKRLTSWTTTGGEARRLAKQIKEKYGIDMVQEARLRQMSMELVWDPRAQTFFKSWLNGKNGMIEWIKPKIQNAFVNKEWVIKEIAWKGIQKPQAVKPLAQSGMIKKWYLSKNDIPNSSNSRVIPSIQRKNVIESEIPWAKKTTVETPMNPKGNESSILANKRGVMVKNNWEMKLLPSGDRMRKQTLTNISNDIAIRTQWARYGWTWNTRVESKISDLLSKWEITQKEALEIVKSIKNNPKYSYIDEKALNKYIGELEWGNKVESFDDLVNNKPVIKPTIKEQSPKEIYDKLQEMANDGRYGMKSWDKLAEEFKQMTGKDIMDTWYDDFLDNGMMKWQIIKNPSSTTTTESKKGIVVPIKLLPKENNKLNISEFKKRRQWLIYDWIVDLRGIVPMRNIRYWDLDINGVAIKEWDIVRTKIWKDRYSKPFEFENNKFMGKYEIVWNKNSKFATNNQKNLKNKL